MARARALILDDDDPPPRHSEAREAHRDAFEWGLASTLIGTTLMIVAPLVLLLIVASSRGSYDGYSSSHGEVAKIEAFSYLGVIGAVIFSIVGFLFGRHGLTRARAERTAAALPVSGMLLCLAALCIWLLAAVVVLASGLS